MTDVLTRFRELRQPPLWVYLVQLVLTPVVFQVAFPFGPDTPPDVILEGLYLLLAVVIAVPIRRLEIGILENAWLIFMFGRYIDFLEELFVEPEPLVEPYLSGVLIIISFFLLMLGTVTLLRERDERLEKLEARNKELDLKNKAIEEAPIGITISDMTTDEEPLITVNEGFSRVTGYEPEDVVGRNCRFLQGEDTSEQKVARMREAIDAGDSVQVTIRNYRQNGDLFWNEITLAPLERNGTIQNYVGFQQNKTDEVEYEQRLQAQRDNLQLLGQMVRHDIRNNLQVMKGQFDLLHEHVTEDGKARLQTAEERTDHAIELTTMARELTELMLNDEPSRKPIALVDSLDTQIDEVRSTFDTATIERSEPLPDVSVMADDMLDSVFHNILKNAIQHNTADIPEVTVSATAENDTVRVRIADNGPGIPDSQKETIFGKGEMGSESAGTGIGTYLVETLVTRYGGDVWIEDNDPEGAVFVIELPVTSSSA